MSTDLVVQDTGEIQQGGVVRLAAGLDQIVEAFQDYTKACDRLLTPDDFQKIGPKKFKKKSAWRKLQTAFGISTRIVSKDIAYEDGRIHHAEFVVRAEAPNGRTAEAWAGASRLDRKEGGFSHDQDIAATAQTRATSRAIADLIGSGEVSAEEVSDGERQRPPSGEPPETSQNVSGAAYTSDEIAASVALMNGWKDAMTKASSKPEWKDILDDIKGRWEQLTDYHQAEITPLFDNAFAAWKKQPSPA